MCKKQCICGNPLTVCDKQDITYYDNNLSDDLQDIANIMCLYLERIFPHLFLLQIINSTFKVLKMVCLSILQNTVYLQNYKSKKVLSFTVSLFCSV